MRKKLPILVAVLLLMSGCAVKTLPPVKRYSIEQTVRLDKTYSVKDCDSFGVEFPQSDGEIMSKNMIYVRGFEKNRYYFSKWFETPNTMISRLLYSALNSSKICKNIYYTTDNSDVDYVLHSKILEFDQVFDQNRSYGVVNMVFYITNKSGAIVSQKDFYNKTASLSNDAKGGVVSLNESSQKVIKKAIEWIYKTLSK